MTPTNNKMQKESI